MKIHQHQINDTLIGVDHFNNITKFIILQIYPSIPTDCISSSYKDDFHYIQLQNIYGTIFETHVLNTADYFKVNQYTIKI